MLNFPKSTYGGGRDLSDSPEFFGECADWCTHFSIIQAKISSYDISRPRFGEKKGFSVSENDI